tara:strand:+ start:402 stop:749 length:348 start_codon:yes stop_codon:yes gene_type:complete
MKCTINDKREITGFWKDNVAPKDALDCDTGKLTISFHAIGNPENETYLYKLSEDGVVSSTDAGIDFETKQYQRDRATSYPSIQEQLDMQYWDAVNGTKKWIDAVTKVKIDNPKPK